MRRVWVRIIFLKVVFLIALSSTKIHAASLGVWPINPRIDAPASATMVWVKNNHSQDNIVLQARVLKWTQSDNKDEYELQDDLVVSPPLITVKPGSQQIFRIVNRKGIIGNVLAEQSFRLMIDEIPVEGKQSQGPLNFQMRYSLPLFVGVPEEYADKTAEHRLKEMANGLRYRLIALPEPVLEISNDGNFNARLSKVKIKSAGMDSVVLSEGLLGYVLVGATKAWPLNASQLKALQQQRAVVVFEQDRQELEIVQQ
jgi:fimbrial chaperone protein